MPEQTQFPPSTRIFDVQEGGGGTMLAEESLTQGKGLNGGQQKQPSLPLLLTSAGCRNVVISGNQRKQICSGWAQKGSRCAKTMGEPRNNDDQYARSASKMINLPD